MQRQMQQQQPMMMHQQRRRLLRHQQRHQRQRQRRRRQRRQRQLLELQRQDRRIRQEAEFCVGCPALCFCAGCATAGGLISYVLYLMGSAALKLKFYKEKGLEGGFLFSWFK